MSSDDNITSQDDNNVSRDDIIVSRDENSTSLDESHPIRDRTIVPVDQLDARNDRMNVFTDHPRLGAKP
jgi:hypothetical protein